MFGLLTAVALLLLGSSMGPAGAAQRAAGAPETAGGVPAPGDSARAAGSTAVAPAEPPTAAAAILWADDFSDPASGWSRQSSDPSKALVGYSYGSGEYYVVKVAGWRGSWVARSGRKFGDFQAEVDARLEPPAEGAYLFLTFRHQENRDQFQFGVDPHGGRFRLLRRVDDRFTSLIGWTEAAAIQGDTGLNRLGVLAQSPELVLLVNGEEVGRARDELWREGRVGLGVGHFQEERAEARFGSLLVVRADSPAS